jgi:hypothetical protein
MTMLRRILVAAVALGALAMPAAGQAAGVGMTCTFDGARGSMATGTGTSVSWQTTANCVIPLAIGPAPAWWFPTQFPKVTGAAVTATGTATKTACGTYTVTGLMSVDFTYPQMADFANAPYTLTLAGGQGLLQVARWPFYSGAGYRGDGHVTFLPDDFECFTHEASRFSLSGEITVNSV